MSNVFTELSLVILITTVISLVMKLLRQPLILGYILAGLILGQSVLNMIQSTEMFETFSTIGIALLLFIIGLGMNIQDLRKLGKVVGAIALSILSTVSVLGLIISLYFGYSTTEAVLIGLALFFSSTIIIVKILSDKKEHHRLHGQISIGVILFDDLVATIALLYIATSKSGGLQVADGLLLAVKGIGLIGGLYLCSSKLLPKIIKFVASSQELLFLTAIAWGFGVASLFDYLGFSVEIGALFAGVALASSPYSQEIATRLKPLRDFFIILFFIVLGESMNVSSLSSAIWPAIILSFVVIVLKPLVIFIAMGLMGFTKRVSFKSAINLSQISEFSIIMIVLASNSQLIDPKISVIITLVAIITIATSTYLMLYDNLIYKKLINHLRIGLFEKASDSQERTRYKKTSVLLFGYHDGGNEFIKTFESMNKKLTVVDYDPEVMEIMEKRKIPFIFGDATDMDTLEELDMNSVELVISTFTDFEASKQLVSNIRGINSDIAIINQASNQSEALALYEAGSTYVIIPHHIGSQKVSSFIKQYGYSIETFDSHRQKHLEDLAITSQQ